VIPFLSGRDDGGFLRGVCLPRLRLFSVPNDRQTATMLFLPLSTLAAKDLVRLFFFFQTGSSPLPCQISRGPTTYFVPFPSPPRKDEMRVFRPFPPFSFLSILLFFSIPPERHPCRLFARFFLTAGAPPPPPGDLLSSSLPSPGQGSC